jgi:predicted DNA-binding transcriptional regulator YafY
VAGRRSKRLDLVDQVLAVARAARRPQTAAQLAEATGLGQRTVYRVLASMPDAFEVHVMEGPRRAGPGKRTRLYTVRTAGGEVPAMLGELRAAVQTLRGGGDHAAARRRLLRLVGKLERAWAAASGAPAGRPRR